MEVTHAWPDNDLGGNMNGCISGKFLRPGIRFICRGHRTRPDARPRRGGRNTAAQPLFTLDAESGEIDGRTTVCGMGMSISRQAYAMRSDAPGRREEEAEDVVLIGRIARGEVPAFESLFRRYRPRIRRFLELKTWRPQLIDEILNDTMLVIWRRAGSFNLRSTVSTWILGIALRRGLKANQRTDRAIALESDAGSAACDLEEHVFRNEIRARLDRALRSFSAEQRAVVVLTYFEGYSYREIAEIVGCPVATVKTRMFHARRRLKTFLPDRWEDAA